MSLKNKTVLGVFWNSIETFGGQLIQIIITIILARILDPEDFGVIGLLVIFTELSKVILDSGFSQALIRKQDTNQKDYTSVFYFNIIIGLFIYILLFLVAPSISRFYDYPELTKMSRVLFLTVLINSFSIVQNAKIIRSVNFKVLAKRTIIANILSGIIAVLLAYYGFGVWALIYQFLIASVLRVMLLWNFSKWRPSINFSIQPIKEMLPFSANILLSNIFDVIATNIHTLLIGKYYSKMDLGFYSQANQLARIPSRSLTLIIKNVTYPTLSVIQENIEELKQAYRKVISISFFIVFPLMLGLISIGNLLIPMLLGDKWIPSINYFMLLCIIGAFYPLYSISQNIFLIRGNTKTYLKITIIQRIITLTAVLITIQYSIMALVIGQVISFLINTLIMMIYSGKEINYKLNEQFYDLAKSFFSSLLMVLIIYLVGQLSSFRSIFLLLLIQFIIAVIIYISLSIILKNSAFQYIKNIFIGFFNNKNVNV